MFKNPMSVKEEASCEAQGMQITSIEYRVSSIVDMKSEHRCYIDQGWGPISPTIQIKPSGGAGIVGKGGRGLES